MRYLEKMSSQSQLKKAILRSIEDQNLRDERFGTHVLERNQQDIDFFGSIRKKDMVDEPFLHSMKEIIRTLKNDKYHIDFLLTYISRRNRRDKEIIQWILEEGESSHKLLQYLLKKEEQNELPLSKEDSIEKMTIACEDVKIVRPLLEKNGTTDWNGELRKACQEGHVHIGLGN